MPFSTITNGNFETACAAIPAPYGPLTRVGGVANMSPNSHVAIEVTSALGETFYVSYNQLQDWPTMSELLREVHASSHSAWADEAINAALVLYRLLGDHDVAGTTFDTEARLALYRIQQLAAMQPIMDWIEYDVDPTAFDAVPTISKTGTREYTINFFVQGDFDFIYARFLNDTIVSTAKSSLTQNVDGSYDLVHTFLVGEVGEDVTPVLSLLSAGGFDYLKLAEFTIAT